MVNITREMVEEMEAAKIFGISNLKACPDSTISELSKDSLIWLIDRVENYLFYNYYKRNYPEAYADYQNIQLPRLKAALKSKES